MVLKLIHLSRVMQVKLKNKTTYNTKENCKSLAPVTGKLLKTGESQI